MIYKEEQKELSDDDIEIEVVIDHEQSVQLEEAPPASKRAVAFDFSSANSPGTESKILEEIWETDAKLRWTPSQQNVPDFEAKYKEVADSSNSDLSGTQKPNIPTIAEKPVEEKKRN